MAGNYTLIHSHCTFDCSSATDKCIARAVDSSQWNLVVILSLRLIYLHRYGLVHNVSSCHNNYTIYCVNLLLIIADDRSFAHPLQLLSVFVDFPCVVTFNRITISIVAEIKLLKLFHIHYNVSSPLRLVQ